MSAKKISAWGWAIIGIRGLYTGWWHTRQKAIREHTSALDKSWKYCRDKGDRAVRVSIIVEAPDEA